jgi:hypothetical protein
MSKINNMNARPRKPRKNPLLLALLGLLLVAGLVYLFLNRPNHGSGPIPATTPQQQTHAADKQELSAENVSTSAQADKNTSPSAATPSPSSDVALAAPSGTFISIHRPSLGSSSKEESLCRTTPGASCFIKFTKDSVIKTLPTQTADANGTVIWDWDVKQAGFDAGTWQITAVATLNGQTKTTNDPIKLEVQP